MDSKLYIEWRETLGMWVVKFQGRVVSQRSTQAEAEQWAQNNYPNHGYEIERVVVRSNSPHGVKKGEWR
jgi:hypothetical protein